MDFTRFIWRDFSFQVMIWLYHPKGGPLPGGSRSGWRCGSLHRSTARDGFGGGAKKGGRGGWGLKALSWPGVFDFLLMQEVYVIWESVKDACSFFCLFFCSPQNNSWKVTFPVELLVWLLLTGERRGVILVENWGGLGRCGVTRWTSMVCWLGRHVTLIGALRFKMTRMVGPHEGPKTKSSLR